MKLYDACVFIGRFQPFHNGHLAVVKEGLKRSKRLIILVGSANSARNLYNPFTFQERHDMIMSSLSPKEQEHVVIEPLPDSKYNDDLWVTNVQKSVASAFLRGLGPWHPLATVALIGHAKDHTSYYLKLFPQWDSVDVDSHKMLDNKNESLSATDLRKNIFKEDAFTFKNKDSIYHHVHYNVYAFIKSFMKTEEGTSLIREQAFINKYKEQWSVAPYAPTFVTVDAIVVQSGHVLLVERAAEPGKGQWAMPGGFINQNEKLIDAVLRELREETKIKVPVPVLRGNITKKDVFDDPNRSMRGRTITHAYLIQLPDDVMLPKVKGSDDAAKAKWWPLSEVKCEMMYEDHYHIIQAMIGGL